MEQLILPALGAPVWMVAGGASHQKNGRRKHAADFLASAWHKRAVLQAKRRCDGTSPFPVQTAAPAHVGCERKIKLIPWLDTGSLLVWREAPEVGCIAVIQCQVPP